LGRRPTIDDGRPMPWTPSSVARILQRRLRDGTRVLASVRRPGEDQQPDRNCSNNIEGSTVDRFEITDQARGSAGEGREAPALKRASGAGVAAATLALVALAFAPSAHASFLPPELMDKAAMYIAWFVIICVPIGGIVLFWLVHILPEKIAHKRHHPQRDAIQVLCLLSLVFGGLLWPLAWLWAYVKPIGYRMAYGTEKHEDYYHEMGEKAQAGDLLEHELAHLREELDTMAAKGTLTAELKALRKALDDTKRTPAAPSAAQAATAAAGAQTGSV